METGRFRCPKTEAEEIALLSETVPKNTKYNTKWAREERFYSLAEHENEQKSAEGNNRRERT